MAKVKSVNIFLGFFFLVNFCLGTGFLGIPYSFFNSGYLAAVPTLIIILLISWINATYLLEVMARAQALEYINEQEPSNLNGGADYHDDDIVDPVLSVNNYMYPRFEITLKRKFEVVELCEIFFNKWIKYIYLILLSVYCFLASWSFTTVAGSAWAVNIPYNFSGVMKCTDPDAFHHSVLPSDEGCRNAYYFSLFIFAIIVVTLSLLDLKEQAIIQMILGIMRFITVGAIIVYSIVKASQGTDVCVPEQVNTTGYSPEDGWLNVSNASDYIRPRDIVLRFDPQSWLTAIPVLTYAFIIHQGIASLTHPIKQKKYLWYLIIAMFGVAGFCYLILGLVAPIWFKATTQETVTLKFSDLTSPLHSLSLRLLAYYLILFPSLDVASAYPLMVHTVVNNFYIIIVGYDTSKSTPDHLKWHFFFFQLFLRLVVAIGPILAAFGVANLIYVLKYAGLIGFNMCFFFPTLLQFRSIQVCKKKFSLSHISISGSHDDDEEEEEKRSLLSASGSIRSSQSLQRVQGKRESSKYMTPYSSAVLSHPISVVVVGLVGVCMFLLTLGSLAVHPRKVTCETGY